MQLIEQLKRIGVALHSHSQQVYDDFKALKWLILDLLGRDVDLLGSKASAQPPETQHSNPYFDTKMMVHILFAECL